MACHQVGKVAEGLRRVVSFPDVDVDSAHMEGVAFRSLVSQPPEEFLQGFDVGVGQNRRYQFGLFAVLFRAWMLTSRWNFHSRPWASHALQV